MSVKVQNNKPVNTDKLHKAIEAEISGHEAARGSQKCTKSYDGKDFEVMVPKDSKAADAMRKSKEYVEVPFNGGKGFMSKATHAKYKAAHDKGDAEIKAYKAGQGLKKLTGESIKTIKWEGYAQGAGAAKFREIIHHRVDIDLSKYLKPGGKTPVKAPEAGPMGPKDPLNQVFGRID